MSKYCIGIDIGTASVRASLIDVSNGQIVQSKTHPICVYEPKPDFFEQSSLNIYESICKCTRGVVKDVVISSVVGIGIDATCSLVAVDGNGESISISPTGEKDRNIILWADHRAIKQATRINKGKHSVLKYVGGKISPEMETPKMLWIKENLPGVFEKDVRFFDLSDYFVYKLTGCEKRSTCTTTCKWTYVAGKGWDSEYLKAIGLEELSKDNFKAIGQEIVPLGTSCGTLKKDVAKELGLADTTVVAVGVIDAHCAGIGIVGAKLEKDVPLENRLALIAGTSCCHMAVSKEAVFVDGVWGPYKDAMLPGFFLSEGGQSAVGKLIDHVVKSHAYYLTLLKQSEKEGVTVYKILNRELKKMRNDISFLTSKVHVLPYFHGNRSPIANPELKGMVCGLTISNTLEDLCIVYLSTIQALAFGTKHIIQAMNESGHKISEVFICGGLKNNPVYVDQHAQILEMDIHLPSESESACVGGAILGSVAAGIYPSVSDAMEKMNKIEKSVLFKEDEKRKKFFEKKYKIFRKMYEHQLEYKKVMGN